MLLVWSRTSCNPEPMFDRQTLQHKYWTDPGNRMGIYNCYIVFRRNFCAKFKKWIFENVWCAWLNVVHLYSSDYEFKFLTVGYCTHRMNWGKIEPFKMKCTLTYYPWMVNIMCKYKQLTRLITHVVSAPIKFPMKNRIIT